jgi:prepilin-type N-terminal cleavage/methylation domain-containing protein
MFKQALSTLRRIGGKRSQKGFTLIEVLIGVTLLTIITAAGFVTLASAMNAQAVSNKRTTAVSLANTVMENAKGTATKYQFAMDTGGNLLPYFDYAAYAYANPGTNVLDEVLSSIPSNYMVAALDDQGNIVNDKVYGIPWNIEVTPDIPQTSGVDAGIQKITIIIFFNNQEVYRLADFKTNR